MSAFFLNFASTFPLLRDSSLWPRESPVNRKNVSMINDLALHIEYLLRRRDCVTVPGFGAFIAGRKGASLTSDSIVAPTIEYCFNPAVRNDDGLLASSYARRMQTPFEEGRQLLADDIAYLREALGREGEVSVGRLGSLELTDDDTLLFHPLRTPQAASESIGMAAISLLPDRPTELSPEATTAVPDEAVSGVGPTDARVADSGRKEDYKRRFDNDRYWYLPINKTFTRAAACFILVAGIALSVWIAGYHTQNQQQFASPVPAQRTELAPSQPATSMHQASVPNLAEAASASEASEDSKAAASDKYYLIVATFHSLAEAEKFISMADDSRLSAVSSGKTVRVSAKSSDSKEDLLTLMRDNDFKASYSQSWIWTDPAAAAD